MLWWCLLFAVYVKYVSAQSTCQGKWIEVEKPEPFWGLSKSYLAFNNNKQEILAAMCPAETIYNSCFYGGMIERANKLLHRRWEYDNDAEPHCEQFLALNFLDKFRNRNLFIAGDSISNQLFQDIACKIAIVVEIPTDNWFINFKYMKMDHGYVPRICPFEALHCYLDNINNVYIEEYNVSITSSSMVSYTPNQLRDMIDLASITSNDIILYNFGLHLNDKKAYEEAINNFLEEYTDIRDKGSLGVDASDLFKNNFYFLETTPQHFPTVNKEISNGYYSSSASYRGNCVPLNGSIEEIRVNDWRNQIMRNKMSPLGVKIIPIAEGLYSQYDAHIDSDSKIADIVSADCTHFCASSQVFQYVWSQIVHAIMTH